jgi:hypothetical protein
MAISAKFVADFSQFTTAVQGAERSLQGLETSAKTLGPAILASLASTELRRFATDVQGMAKDFIGAFAEEQAAVSRLTTALQAQGTYTPQLADRYAELGAAFQKSTRFSDDAIFSTQALLVQVGGVMPGQMQAALTAITNLAAGMGPQVGGLEGATLLVAKAFSGGGESLGRLKIILGESLKPGADMAGVLEAINTKFGGQAAADMATYVGRTEALKNQMSDFNEKIGQLIVEGLTPLLNAFGKLPEGMQTTIIAVVAIGTALTPLALSFGALVTVLTPLIPLIGVALKAAFVALLPFIGTAGLIALGVGAVVVAFYKWDAIVGIAQKVYEGVKLWLVDKFTAIVEWVNQKIRAIIAAFQGMYMAVSGGSIVPDMLRGIESEFLKLDRVMVQPVVKATMQTVGEFQGMAGGAPTLSAGARAGSSGVGSGVVVPVTINGSVLSNPHEIARVVGDAVMGRLTGSGVRLPVGA